MKSFAVLIIFSFMGLAIVPEVIAQDNASKKEQTSSEEGKSDKPKTLFDKLAQAGGWMVPLYIFSIAALTLTIYNLIQLNKGKFCPPELRLALLDHMQNCRVRSAIDVAATSPSFLGRMMAHSLPAIDATKPEDLGREHVEDQIAEFTIRESRGYMSAIGWFSIIGAIAPMMGLLGTVVGMMGAFDTLGSSGAQNSDKLAGDISLAMITTAGGLMVAMPSLFAFFFFKNRLNSLIATCHSAASEMMDASIATVNAENFLAKVPEGLA